MKKKSILSAIALFTLLALALTGCGAKDAAETTAAPGEIPGDAVAQDLSLANWSMSATTWSSPNGATVHITAAPVQYTDGQSAKFVVRLEGDEIENVPCQWDGTHYTASAELNAADGYSYYVVLTAADGSQSEVAVNTSTAPIDEALVNMASSLQSYCNLTVTESEMSGSKLILTAGSAEIQLPRITNEGETIVCKNAVLVLTFEGTEVAAAELTLTEPSDSGSYTLSVVGTEFEIPALEDDQQLVLRLDVTLSNNQTLTSPGGAWFYNDGSLLMAVG